MARTPCKLARTEPDMNRDQSQKLQTKDGGKQINTEYQTSLTVLDGLIIGARFAACLMCAISVIMVAFYWF